MKKYFIILGLAFSIFGFVNINAQELPNDLEELLNSPESTNGVDCFDYYKFQSVQVNVGPDKSNYSSGETVNFFGKLENQNSSPVFNGYVYVRISEKNPNYIKEGHNIADEFIALGPVAIDASSTKPISFSWKIPENLKTGGYTADYFFSVNKKFNLGGLPFTNEIIVGNSYFNIASEKMGNVYFDKATTKVNDVKYNHIGEWPMIPKGEKVNISQSIVNSLKQDATSEITYDLYFWDSLNQKDLISTKKETVTLKALETKTLSYEISKVEKSVYYLQITAKNSNGTKSVVNIRTTSDFGTPRINYFGLNNFPIEKGATSTLFFCYHNTSNNTSTGTAVLIAEDRAGNKIAEAKYDGTIYSSVSAEKTDFTALSKLDYVKLEQKMYDDKNNLIDQEEIVYDASSIKEPAQTSVNKINLLSVYITVFLLIFGLLLFFIRPIRKNKNLCLVISAILIILIFVLVLELFGTEFVKAQSTISNFQKSQSGTIAKPFSIGYSGKRVNEVYKGSAQYVYTIETTATSSSLKMGDTLGFWGRSLGEFNGVGGSMDTPFLGQTDSYSVPGNTPPWIIGLDAARWESIVEPSARKGWCVGGTGCVGGAYGTDGLVSTYKAYYPYSSDSRYGYKKVSDVPKLGLIIPGKETVVIERRLYRESFGRGEYRDVPRTIFTPDNSVIDCTSGVCNAVGVGKAVVKVKILPSEVILGYSYPIAFQLYKEKPSEGYRDSIPFEGFTATWEFEVLPTPSIISTTTVPSSGCSEIIYDYTWGECINSISKEVVSIKVPCSGATNQPRAVNSKSCYSCTDKYKYTWTECGVDDEESFGTPSLDVDCPEDVSITPPIAIKPCDGHTKIEKESACEATQNSKNSIYVNKNMTWNVKIPEGLSGLIINNTIWSGAGIIGEKLTTATTTLNNIYTTVGLKAINATTTAKTSDGNTTYVITCSTSTNVIFGGGVQEF